MGKIVITTNASLDGAVQDPDGQEGFKLGGWFVESGGEDLAAWVGISVPSGTSRRARNGMAVTHPSPVT
jgi:hypothetical protein